MVQSGDVMKICRSGEHLLHMYNQEPCSTVRFPLPGPRLPWRVLLWSALGLQQHPFDAHVSLPHVVLHSCREPGALVTKQSVIFLSVTILNLLQSEKSGAPHFNLHADGFCPIRLISATVSWVVREESPYKCI